MRFGYFLSWPHYREMIAAYGAEVLPELRRGGCA